MHERVAEMNGPEPTRISSAHRGNNSFVGSRFCRGLPLLFNRSYVGKAVPHFAVVQIECIQAGEWRKIEPFESILNHRTRVCQADEGLESLIQINQIGLPAPVEKVGCHQVPYTGYFGFILGVSRDRL